MQFAGGSRSSVDWAQVNVIVTFLEGAAGRLPGLLAALRKGRWILLERISRVEEPVLGVHSQGCQEIGGGGKEWAPCWPGFGGAIGPLVGPNQDDLKRI